MHHGKAFVNQCHQEKGHHDGEHHDEGYGHHHDHEGIAPHAWLDPDNARLWLDVIARALSEQDPDNAGLYASNAAEGKRVIADISSRVEATVEELGDRECIVFHDACQYFEKRFGISAAGAISIGDASDPGPARIREIRQLVADLEPGPLLYPGLIREFASSLRACSGVDS